MQANVIGRVKNLNLPKNQSLLPVFEAVINSIDAIEEAGIEPQDGCIEIHIKRNIPQLVKLALFTDLRPHNPINGFEIIDNGVGFTDENYKAFNEADTQFKAQRGGKGVGRFLWLNGASGKNR